MPIRDRGPICPDHVIMANDRVGEDKNVVADSYPGSDRHVLEHHRAPADPNWRRDR